MHELKEVKSGLEFWMRNLQHFVLRKIGRSATWWVWRTTPFAKNTANDKLLAMNEDLIRKTVKLETRRRLEAKDENEDPTKVFIYRTIVHPLRRLLKRPKKAPYKRPRNVILFPGIKMAT